MTAKCFAAQAYLSCFAAQAYLSCEDANFTSGQQLF